MKLSFQNFQGSDQQALELTKKARQILKKESGVASLETTISTDSADFTVKLSSAGNNHYVVNVLSVDFETVEPKTNIIDAAIASGTIVHTKGNWYEVAETGEKLNGKKNVLKFLKGE